MFKMCRKPVGHNVGRANGEQGFTLTEVAIVLGIIGLILGAIWVAAAAVYTNMRTSKTTTEMLSIVQNVRAMYGTSGVVDPNADMNGFGVQNSTGLTYIQAGIFPTDTLNAVGANATTAQDPWGGYINIKAAQNLKISDKYMARGSFTFSPRRKAGNGETGATTASTSSNASWKSRAMSARTFCAFR